MLALTWNDLKFEPPALLLATALEAADCTGAALPGAALAILTSLLASRSVYGLLPLRCPRLLARLRSVWSRGKSVMHFALERGVLLCSALPQPHVCTRRTQAVQTVQDGA